MASTKLVSPGTFRGLDAWWRSKILSEIERQGLDHAMYAFIDERGNTTKFVRCCKPGAPCPPDAFRIRRRMAPASREVPAHLLAEHRSLAS